MIMIHPDPHTCTCRIIPNKPSKYVLLVHVYDAALPVFPAPPNAPPRPKDPKAPPVPTPAPRHPPPPLPSAGWNAVPSTPPLMRGRTWINLFRLGRSSEWN